MDCGIYHCSAFSYNGKSSKSVWEESGAYSWKIYRNFKTRFKPDYSFYSNNNERRR